MYALNFMSIGLQMLRRQTGFTGPPAAESASRNTVSEEVTAFGSAGLRLHIQQVVCAVYVFHNLCSVLS